MIDLPKLRIPHLAISWVASKVTVDDTPDIPHEWYEEYVLPVEMTLEEWSSLLDGFDPDNPATWGRVSSKILRRIVKSNLEDESATSWSPAGDYLSERGYEISELSISSFSWYFSKLLEKADSMGVDTTNQVNLDKYKMEYGSMVDEDDDYDVLNKVELGEDIMPFYWSNSEAYSSYPKVICMPCTSYGEYEDIENLGDLKDLNFNDKWEEITFHAGRNSGRKIEDIPNNRLGVDASDKKELIGRINELHQREWDKIVDKMSDIIWHGNDVLEISVEDDGTSLHSKNLPPHEYKGDLYKYIDQWRSYINHGISRCVLLQGVPGTGKTTFSGTVVRELDAKTLYVSKSYLNKGISEFVWRSICNNLIDPDIIIFEDMDRVKRSKLEDYLFLIDSNEYNVPLTLITTNHFSRLPDAFRRPGRIDQCLNMLEPDRKQKIEIINALAEQVSNDLPEGERIGEIPEEGMETLLDHYSKRLREAHIKELIKRCYFSGWEYDPPEEDFTFDNDNFTSGNNKGVFPNMNGQKSTGNFQKEVKREEMREIQKMKGERGEKEEPQTNYTEVKH